MVAVGLLILPAAGAPADFTYQSGVSEVRIAFFASDAQHRGIETLQSDDFAVVDNGLVIRHFRSFHRSDLTKLQVVVLVDASQSVLSHFRQEMADVMRVIWQQPSIADEDISIVSFGGMRSTLLCSGNCRSDAATNQLLETHADGATPLFDALEFTGNLITEHRNPEARPVIILFSDGEDTISKTPANRALETVLASEAQLYAVDLSPETQRSIGSATLDSMSEATGGRHLFIQQGASDILQTVLEDLHAGYLVTYKLPNQNAGFHWVRILPTRDLNLQFRCRRGYVYQTSNR